MKKTPDPTKAESSAPSTREFRRKSTATEAQRQRLIELLRIGQRITYELRRHGISHPAGRIKELIWRGFVITSDRVTTVDADGFTHKGVALYTLISEPEGRKAKFAPRKPMKTMGATAHAA